MAANIYQAVKQAMQDLIAPQLESLKGEVGAARVDIQRVEEKLSGEIRRVDDKLSTEILHLDGRLSSQILRVEEKLSSEILRVDEKLSSEIHRIDDKLTWALDLRERIVALETKLAITAGS